MRERRAEARKDFDKMLSENAFVDFWGRLGKIGGKGVDEGIRADDIGEDEGAGEEGQSMVDMKALAKTVDLKEMVKVLKVGRDTCLPIPTWIACGYDKWAAAFAYPNFAVE